MYFVLRMKHASHNVRSAGLLTYAYFGVNWQDRGVASLLGSCPTLRIILIKKPRFHGVFYVYYDF